MTRLSECFVRGLRGASRGALIGGAVAVLSACAGDPFVDDGDPNANGAQTDGGTAGSVTGLPCDVAQVLQARCTSCHGAQPSGGAPVSLNSYEALTAQSKQVPGQTVAARSLARMEDAAAPMPPQPASAATATEIATLQAWIDAGTPRGTCATGPDPINAAPVCTSKTLWTRGDAESPLMHPGGTCISCHTQRRGPALVIGGTVYPTGHEPDECYGTSGAQVVITDASGKKLTLSTTASGNFSATPRQASIALPYTAKVVYQGRERVMVAAQQSGDCNTCHTQAGANGAPGRIVLP